MSDHPEPFQSLAEVYGRGAYAHYARSRRIAGTAGAVLVRFAQPGGAFPDPPTPDYTLAINERGSGRMRFDFGAGRRDIAFRRGDLVLKPPGVATFVAADAAHQKSFVSLPAALVEEVAADSGRLAPERAPPDLRRLHAGSFQSALLAGLLETLWREPAIGSPAGRLVADGILLALVAGLVRLATPDLPEAPARPALSAARLARVQDYVEAHLGEPFGLAEMAAAVGLSPWHFSRAFKAATGRTPRDFVAAARVERAKALLAQGRLPLSQVAQACGFADQAHFSTAFRRQAGTTPGAWRRGL